MVHLNEAQEEAIKKMAQELSISSDNKLEVIEATLNADGARVHKYGYSKREFAKMKSRCKGLNHYICGFTL